ncbi:MAG: threonine synthase [Clostridiales bacterium]|nr:threonine synthase [Candidatus Crickella merdequi]
MINYISTRNDQTKITSAEAILNGLAPDGGLYVPEDIEAIKVDYKEIIAKDYRGMAKAVFNKFFPDFGEDRIDAIVERSYENKFTAPEITPLVKVGAGYVLELYHGPTCAFKDVALSALPNLMTVAREMTGFTDEILILTATSGDTGSAALHGFSDVPGTSIIVFFPDGGVSETQKLQMVTQSGKNTCATAVKGNFDDAQSGVKKLFTEIPQPAAGVSLSSANSINIGRLVPQVVYYFSAYKSLVESGEIELGDKVNYTVPTGNFGDIMAGYFAMKMGLPVGKLICASNKNDVLTEFLETGHYDKRRTFYKTTSPSMDILVSSNLERLLYYVCGLENSKKYMKALSECGEYTIEAEELAAIREVFVGIACDDETGAATIGNTFANEKYLMDTHTAIAWSAFEEFSASGAEGTENKNVVLSTASPYKFTRAVIEALGEEVEAADEDNMIKLNKLTGAAVPAPLAGIFSKEIMHKDVIECSAMKDYVVAKASR